MTHTHAPTTRENAARTDAARILNQWDAAPGAVAACWEGSPLTRGRLASLVRGFAAALAARGLSPGARVALRLPDSPAFLQAFLGANLFGAVPVPLAPQLPHEEQATILEDSGADLLVIPEDADAQGLPLGQVLRCPLAGLETDGPTSFLAPAPDPACPAFLQYTSGSTGRPKGVIRAHGDLFVAASAFGDHLLGPCADGPADVVLCASKMSFSYGLQVQIACALARGATLVLDAGPPDAARLLELIARHKVTAFFAVPAIYALLLRETGDPAPLASLRLCHASGEALPAAVFSAWKRLTGLAICEGLGATETFTTFLTSTPGQAAPGSLGRAAPGFEVALTDAGGARVTPGQTGRLRVRGPGMTPGYWRKPEESAALRLDGGWLETGDLCVEEAHGLRHAGRLGDSIKSGGEWISPLPIEDCLRTHPDVLDCAVTPCRVMGLEHPMAHVVPRQPGTAGSDLAQALREHVLASLPRHMCPVRVAFRDSLPRTVTGKVKRRDLREAEPGSAPHDRNTAP